MKYIIRLALLFAIILIFCKNFYAQANIKDSLINTPMLTIHYAAQMPANDLAQRFGFNSNIGAGFTFKNKKNFLIATDFNYIFGDKVKQDSLLHNISTSNNQVIATDGTYSVINVFERGYYVTFKLGKIIPIFGPNKNSGILIAAGSSFLQHKIRILPANNDVYALRDEKVKGFDKLASGWGLNQFIGYLYLGNNRLISFYAGIELVQTWTQGRRSWDTPSMKPYNEKRFDCLNGLKFGWIIPLYKRTDKGYFYF